MVAVVVRCMGAVGGGEGLGSQEDIVYISCAKPPGKRIFGR